MTSANDMTPGAGGDQAVTLLDKFNMALMMERQGNFSNALNAYIDIINEDSTFRKAYLNLGSLYARMKKYESAMQCYSRAQELGQDYLTSFNIGSVLYTQGEYKKAVLNLERSKAMNPGFMLSNLVMGLCYSRMNNIKAAETNFIHVLNSSPNNKIALTALAIIYYNSRKFDEAVKLLNRILSINSGNHVIRKLKSEILFRTGNIDESLNELKTVTNSKDGFRIYDEFIKSVPVEVYTDRYGTMDDKINSLMEKSENDNDSLISLSLCHLLKGDTDTAMDYLFKARKKIVN